MHLNQQNTYRPKAMNPPLETDNAVWAPSSASKSASKAKEDTSLCSVLELAQSLCIEVHVDDEGNQTSNVPFPSSKKQRLSPSSRRQLKNKIKSITASQVNQVHEMNRMTKIAMSRAPDDFAINSCDYSALTKSKPHKESSLADLMSSPVGSVDLLSIMSKFSSPDDKHPKASSRSASKEVTSLPEYMLLTSPHPQGGLSRSTDHQQSPPSPPCRRASFLSSEEGDVSSQDLIAAINPEPVTHTTCNSSPESTPETRRFQLQPRYSSPWLSKLDPRSMNTEASSPYFVTPNNDQVSTMKAEVSKPFKPPRSIDAGMPQSSSRGALIRIRLSSMSKLAPSLSSTSLSKTAKRLNKSFGSLPCSKVDSVTQGEENRPVANTTWDTACIASAESPMSSKIYTQGHHASISSLQNIVASAAELIIKTSSTNNGNGQNGQAIVSSSEGAFKQRLSVPSPPKFKASRNNSPGGNSSMMRLNKSLGSLSLGQAKEGHPGREGCHGGNAAWGNFQLSSKNASLGNLRKRKKIMPAGAMSPSPNAEWGAM